MVGGEVKWSLRETMMMVVVVEETNMAVIVMVPVVELKALPFMVVEGKV